MLSTQYISFFVGGVDKKALTIEQDSFVSITYMRYILSGVGTRYSTFSFYRQLNFPSEPGVANEILEHEPKSFLTVA